MDATRGCDTLDRLLAIHIWQLECSNATIGTLPASLLEFVTQFNSIPSCYHLAPLVSTIVVACGEIVHLREGLLVARLADLFSAVEGGAAVFAAIVVW